MLLKLAYATQFSTKIPISTMTDPQRVYYALNESSLTVVFGNTISSELAEKILWFDQAIHAAPFAGFRTTIPAYATLTVCYDPKVVIQSSLKGASSYDKVSGYLSGLNPGELLKESARRLVSIPVCYGGELGPDLTIVAAQCKLSTDEVIALHSANPCNVHMIGFVPGFAYMGGMDRRLSTPRKEQPRSRVAAGSVGIAGSQTGIYSLDIPGGWQIIGRTPLRLFDAGREVPSLLKAGDQVVFSPISLAEFHSLTS
jgi:inhibitor of KinA